MTTKIAIIGGGSNTTFIKALVRAIEEKTGDKVDYVQIHEKDAEFLTPVIPSTDKLVLVLPSDNSTGVDIDRLKEIDKDRLSQNRKIIEPIILKPVEPVENRYTYEPKRKGHERPYKYHP